MPYGILVKKGRGAGGSLVRDSQTGRHTGKRNWMQEPITWQKVAVLRRCLPACLSRVRALQTIRSKRN